MSVTKGKEGGRVEYVCKGMIIMMHQESNLDKEENEAIKRMEKLVG